MPAHTDPNWQPKYRRHKRSGQAYVSIQGRDYYLGDYGSAESKVQYRRLVAEFTLTGLSPTTPQAKATDGQSDRTVGELVLAAAVESEMKGEDARAISRIVRQRCHEALFLAYLAQECEFSIQRGNVPLISGELHLEIAIRHRPLAGYT
jgi:hypothetical protein